MNIFIISSYPIVVRPPKKLLPIKTPVIINNIDSKTYYK